ncbi:hypothetical protein SAMN02787144_102867 [Streptomyces atratus]|uniref:Uncharacterized protein n=1 Tax=Streptomyces atratus TaxID=1893 RepID=A0A1K2F432_STRAR|nr:hypothetical protein SAMN02787144_102867 [Streptomyces atratus]
MTECRPATTSDASWACSESVSHSAIRPVNRAICAAPRMPGGRVVDFVLGRAEQQRAQAPAALGLGDGQMAAQIVGVFESNETG